MTSDTIVYSRKIVSMQVPTPPRLQACRQAQQKAAAVAFMRIGLTTQSVSAQPPCLLFGCAWKTVPDPRRLTSETSEKYLTALAGPFWLLAAGLQRCRRAVTRLSDR